MASICINCLNFFFHTLHYYFSTLVNDKNLNNYSQRNTFYLKIGWAMDKTINKPFPNSNSFTTNKFEIQIRIDCRSRATKRQQQTRAQGSRRGIQLFILQPRHLHYATNIAQLDKIGLWNARRIQRIQADGINYLRGKQTANGDFSAVVCPA